jgi:hypothetical protein
MHTYIYSCIHTYLLTYNEQEDNAVVFLNFYFRYLNVIYCENFHQLAQKHKDLFIVFSFSDIYKRKEGFQ